MIEAASVVAPSFRVTKAQGVSPSSGRAGDDGGFQDGRVAVEDVLDLDRRDVLAAGDDDVLRAVLDLDVAVGVGDREVAGVEPAPAKASSVAVGFFR